MRRCTDTLVRGSLQVHRPRVDSDERLLLVLQQMEAAGVDPSGMPRDPKTAALSAHLAGTPEAARSTESALPRRRHSV